MNEHRGLCLCCRNAPTCTFLRNPSEAVLQCDEFDGLESFSQRPKSIPHQGMMDFTSNPGKKDFNGTRGLCGLCEDRETCTYPKPEGGVWHCEEYR